MKRPDITPHSTPAGLRLAALKERLLYERVPIPPNNSLERLLRLAANEAEALAWQTAAPLLVFPALLEEKLDAALRYAAHQAALRRASTPATRAPAPNPAHAAPRAPVPAPAPATTPSRAPASAPAMDGVPARRRFVAPVAVLCAQVRGAPQAVGAPAG